MIKLLLKIVVLLAAGAVCVVAVPNAIMLIGQQGSIRTFEQMVQEAQVGTASYDCVMVLGAAVRPDGTPSAVLQDRIDMAIRLYEAGVAPKILMSGDDQSDTSYDEVTNMKAYAVQQGVPSADVFCDHAGLCTYDSAYRLRHVFEAQRAVVVTQTYHLYRSLYDCSSMGVEVVGVPGEAHEYAAQSWYDIREMGARVSDFVKVVTKQNASYLSEPVSLEQSGDVTSW